jgi:hypothetical protein
MRPLPLPGVGELADQESRSAMPTDCGAVSMKPCLA